MQRGPACEPSMQPSAARSVKTSRRVPRIHICSRCNEHPRNSRYGPLCTQCGQSNDAEATPDAIGLASGQPPMQRQKRAASAGCTQIRNGGIIKRPHGWMPIEILMNLDRTFLDGPIFFDRLAAAAPRLIQELGPGSEAWERGVKALIEPWINQQLRVLGAPAGMAISQSPASVLLATITETNKKKAGGGQLLAHRDYSPEEHPGEEGWNFLILMNETDEREACQVAWLDSYGQVDPTRGKRTREWLDQNFVRMACVGDWGTAYVFDCGVWHGVERMLPRSAMHATRSASADMDPSKGGGGGGMDGVVRCRTSLVIDCRTPNLPPPYFTDPGVQVWRR